MDPRNDTEKSIRLKEIGTIVAKTSKGLKLDKGKEVRSQKWGRSRQGGQLKGNKWHRFPFL